jgi:hypothetical protein
MNDANRSTRHAGICAAVAGVVTVTVLAGCNGSSDWRPEGFAASVGQTRTAVATQTLDKSLKLAPVGIEFTHFASPTGNIECVITSSDGTDAVARSVRCDIDERDWSPLPEPADCELDYGHAVVLGPGAPAEFLCAGDTTIGSGGEPLPYGGTITIGLIRCESAPSGVSCRDIASGNGFSMSRQEYRFF